MQLSVEHIRKHPTVFVGSTEQKGVCNLILFLAEELIYNKNRECVFLQITINDDNSVLFICDQPIDTENNDVVFATKALSDVFELSYKNEPQNIQKILFRPDKELFVYEKIDYYRLYNRLKELAQLNDNVKFLLADKENRNLIQYENGLNAMLFENMYDFNLEGLQPLNISFAQDDVEVFVSMLLGRPADIAVSFVNNYKTHGGGTHVQGLYDGVYHVFKRYAQGIKDEKIEITKKDFISDLNFIISVKAEHPTYGDGCTHRTLSDNRVGNVIKKGIINSLEGIIESDQSFFDASSVIQMAAFMHTFKTAVKKQRPDIDWSD